MRLSMKEWIEKNTYKILYTCVSLIIAIPFINYLIQNKTVFKFIFVNTFTASEYGQNNQILNMVLFVLCFILLFLLYFAIIKNRDKLFKNIKQILIFTCLVGAIFALVIPVTSLDVYSYIGTGWVDSHYNENPYYTSISDIREQIEPETRDEMLLKVARCWIDEPVVYGPAWAFMCKLLTSISFGSIDIALLIFKIAALIELLACTWLIYKITNKKIFAVIFALNPLILFEAVSNVHNDIFLILFMLLGIYFVVKKQKLWLSIIFLAIATGIKYMSVILVPFLVIYALQKEELPKKIGKTVLYAIEFLAVIIGFYAIYMEDFSVLSGLIVQQDKYERSIFLLLNTIINNEQVINILKMLALTIFTAFYVYVVTGLFIKNRNEKITIKSIMQQYNPFLLVFLLVLITNFNAWYLIWLFPTIMWQKSKNIRMMLCLSIGGIMAYGFTYLVQIDSRPMGIPFFFTMIISSLCAYAIWQLKRNKMKKYKNKE